MAGKIEVETNKENAINYFNEAIEKSEGIKRIDTLIMASMWAARLSVMNGRYTEAKNIILENQERIKNETNSKNIARFYEEKGLTEYIMREYEVAWESFSLSLTHYNEADDLYEQANMFYNLSCVSNFLGKERSVFENLQRAVDIDIRFGKMAKSDPDFSNLLNDPEFLAILKE
jgi:tetratricopeptide (TPR) repeat protein